MDLDELAASLVATLAARGLSLAVAESCTGGLLGHSITNVPGSSRVFLGGVVAYADAVKRTVLGVPAAALAEHGAVSAPVALAMARGARQGSVPTWPCPLLVSPAQMAVRRPSRWGSSSLPWPGRVAQCVGAGRPMASAWPISGPSPARRLVFCWSMCRPMATSPELKPEPGLPPGERILARGRLVALRALAWDDLDAMGRWPMFREPELQWANADLRSAAQRRLWFRHEQYDPTRLRFAIVVGERLVGVLGLRGIDWRRHRATLGIRLSAGDVDRGYGTDAIRALFTYAFGQAGLAPYRPGRGGE